MSLLLLLLLLLLIFARRRGADEDEDNDEPEEAPVFFFFGFRLDESRSRRLIWELDCGFLTGGILTVRIKRIIYRSTKDFKSSYLCEVYEDGRGRGLIATATRGLGHACRCCLCLYCRYYWRCLGA